MPWGCPCPHQPRGGSSPLPSASLQFPLQGVGHGRGRALPASVLHRGRQHPLGWQRIGWDRASGERGEVRSARGGIELSITRGKARWGWKRWAGFLKRERFGSGEGGPPGRCLACTIAAEARSWFPVVCFSFPPKLAEFSPCFSSLLCFWFLFRPALKSACLSTFLNWCLSERARVGVREYVNLWVKFGLHGGKCVKVWFV